MSSKKKVKPSGRRSSFKLKITVWITLLIAIVCSLGIFGILITGSQITDSRLQNELIGTVERNVDEIEYKNGILEIENDFAFFVDEVYCNVYDENGRYISGESPTALINGSDLKDGEFGSFEADGSTYYYYDTRLDFQKYEYEIDVFSGQILKYEADTVMSEELSDSVYRETNFENGISSSEAVNIALEHAGLTGDEVSSLGVELSAESDRTVFKVEFICSNSTYPSVWVRGIINADAAMSAFDAINKTIIYIFPSFIVIAALGAYLISRRAMKPVENISRSAREITDGNDLSKRIEMEKSAGEIYSLAETFNEMLARLQTSFENEKQFTSDASHELRTPLAVIKAECEYALSNSADETDMLEALSSIDEQTDKMTRLVTALLTLSRTEQGDRRYKLEDTDLSELVKNICDGFTPAKNIALTSDIESGVIIPAQAQLVTLMLENLLSNAVKYGRENGHIEVTLKKAEKITLSVKDDGVGIKEENLQKIWGRFYRADESRSREEGFGLGLALVKQIAELHGGEAAVSSVYGEGSEFTVTF
ncbi:MAG: sensor histidine kinase [Acutalibacteraceae bacterium]